MTNPGQYSPEKAMDEASLMRGKMEKGEAKTYDEAEQLVEKGQILSVEDIKKYTEELKKKVELAKAQIGWDVERKVMDRETLIAEARTNDALFQPAQEALEYFTAMRDIGSLSDPEDIKKLEEIKATVDSLEKQRLEINKNLESIESNPAVLEKVYEKALGEDVERTINKEYEKAHQQFDPQIDQLWKSILHLASEKNIFWGEKAKLQKDVEDTWKGIKDLGREAIRMLDKPEFSTVINDIFYSSRSTAELKEKLSAARKGLGMFSGKEKAVVDFVLSKTREFQWHEHATDKLAGMERLLETKKAEQTAIEALFKDVMFSAWEVQERVNKLTGDTKECKLPVALHWRLGARATTEAEINTDKDLWITAKSILGDITGGSHGPNYVYRNPRGPEEQQ